MTKRLKKKGKTRDTKKVEKQTKGPVGIRTKYAVYSVLTVTDRVIDKLMDLYKSMFVADEKEKADFYVEEGFNYFEKGDYQKAVESFLTYVENHGSNDVDVLFQIGLSYANMDKNKEAIDYLKKSEEVDGGNPETISELTSCLVKLEKYPEAADYAKRAIRLRPDYAENYYLLGTSYEKTGKSEEAIQMYKKSIDLNPRNTVFYQALGFAYESCGKHDDAIACFKKGMELEKNK